MARAPAAEMGIGDWWNSFQRSGHQERARQHKMQAQHHENTLKALEKSAIDLGGWNPLSAMAKSHHRKLAEYHRAKQDYHESHASDRMTEQEKRDSHGRWTASMAQLSSGAGGFKKKYVTDATGQRRRLYGGGKGSRSELTFRFEQQGDMQAFVEQLSMMGHKGAVSGRRVTVPVQPGTERGIKQAARAHNGLEDETTAAFSFGNGVKAMSRRQHYEARRARQMAMGLAFGPTGGIACAVPDPATVAKVGKMVAENGKAVINCVSKASAAALVAWLSVRHIEATMDGTIVYVMSLSSKIRNDIRTAVSKFGAAVRWVTGKKPAAKEAASFSCPPKFHKLFAGFSMSDDGQPMKDGKPCSSRRARYFAASAAKYHKLYASQTGDASMGIADFVKTTYKRTGDLIKHPVDTVKGIVTNPRGEAQKTIDDYKKRSGGQKHDPSSGRFAGFSMGEDGQVMKDGCPCSSKRARYFKKRHAAMTSPSGQVPSSNPGYGGQDVLN